MLESSEPLPVQKDVQSGDESLSVEEEVLLRLMTNTEADEVVYTDKDLNSNNEKIKGEGKKGEFENLKDLAARRSLSKLSDSEVEQASIGIGEEQENASLVVNKDSVSNQTDSEKGNLIKSEEDELSSKNEKSDNAGEREQVVGLMSKILESKTDTNELVDVGEPIPKQKDELTDDLSPSVDGVDGKQSDDESLDLESGDSIEFLNGSGDATLIEVSDPPNFDDEQDEEEESEEVVVQKAEKLQKDIAKCELAEKICSILEKMDAKEDVNLSLDDLAKKFAEDPINISDIILPNVNIALDLFLVRVFNKKEISPEQFAKIVAIVGPDAVRDGQHILLAPLLVAVLKGAPEESYKGFVKRGIAITSVNCVKVLKSNNSKIAQKILTDFDLTEEEEIKKPERGLWFERAFALSAASVIAYVAWLYLGYESPDKEQLSAK